MKRIMNFTAFLFMVVFVGLWDNNYISFKELLLNAGIVLIILFSAHIMRFALYIFKHNGNGKKSRLVKL